mgnify:CR=1 FL=1
MDIQTKERRTLTMAERMQLATEQDVTNYADETNTKLTTLQSDVTEVKDNTKEV